MTEINLFYDQGYQKALIDLRNLLDTFNKINLKQSKLLLNCLIEQYHLFQESADFTLIKIDPDTKKYYIDKEDQFRV